MRNYLKIAQNMYGKCNEETQAVLRDIFGEAILPIEDRIKTLDDAIEFLGKEHPLVQARDILVSHNTELLKHSVADIELRIICTALNRGSVFYSNEFMPVFTRSYDGLAYSYNELIPEGKNVYQSTDYTLCTRELAEYAGKQFANYWKEALLK